MLKKIEINYLQNLYMNFGRVFKSSESNIYNIALTKRASKRILIVYSAWLRFTHQAIFEK